MLNLPERTRIVEKNGKRYVVLKFTDQKTWDGSYQALYVIAKGIFGNEKLVEVDREYIPADVSISLGCYGDCGNWKSKFYEYI